MGRGWTKQNSNHRQTEIFDVATDHWIEAAECPSAYHTSYFTTASSHDAVFVIGGWAGGSTINKIIRYRNDIWEQMGNLRTSRFSHETLTVGTTHIILVEGIGLEVWNEDFSENLAFYENSSINLANAMFLVDREFCVDVDVGKELSVLHLNQREDINFPLMTTIKGIFRFT